MILNLVNIKQKNKFLEQNGHIIWKNFKKE